MAVFYPFLAPRSPSPTRRVNPPRPRFRPSPPPPAKPVLTSCSFVRLQIVLRGAGATPRRTSSLNSAGARSPRHGRRQRHTFSVERSVVSPSTDSQLLSVSPASRSVVRARPRAAPFPSQSYRCGVAPALQTPLFAVPIPLPRNLSVHLLLFTSFFAPRLVQSFSNRVIGQFV